MATGAGKPQMGWLVPLLILVGIVVIRRCGELLKQFDGRPDNSKKQSEGGLTLMSQREASRAAGLSTHQQRTAVRVANVPAEQFERLVDEYDAAQERGEVGKAGNSSVREELVSAADIGLTHKETCARAYLITVLR